LPSHRNRSISAQHYFILREGERCWGRRGFLRETEGCWWGERVAGGGRGFLMEGDSCWWRERVSDERRELMVKV